MLSPTKCAPSKCNPRCITYQHHRSSLTSQAMGISLRARMVVGGAAEYDRIRKRIGDHMTIGRIPRVSARAKGV